MDQVEAAARRLEAARAAADTAYQTGGLAAFECIAQDWRAERLHCSLAEALAIVAARITDH
jgi:hypothetical protein